MRIFISYSTSDIFIVQQLAEKLRMFGEVFFWAESNIPGKESWETIFNWIDTSDIVIVLITGNTVTRAMSVGQEVGRAKTKNKTIIPIVSKAVSSSELGFLSGVTYQPIDVYNPHPAIEEITKVIQAYQSDMQERQKFAVGLVALGLLLWLASSK